MKQPVRLLALTLALALLPAAAGASATRLTGSDRNILRNDSGVGGEPAAAAAIKLNARVGAVGNASFAGGAFKMHAGLMQVSAQPGTIVQLAAVAKATGTLDLQWTAPGADGFVGNVTAGAYRIDYSSDPANHLFAPTTYQIELTTSVVPGALETYQLTGLVPNSTYYVRIYLADARRYFAEDSKHLEESTLANPAVDPFFASVNSSSVTISWLLPDHGAEGYEARGASTTLGLEPGGTISSSQTSNGQLLTLVVDNLRSGTTYFFKVASLNWQGEKTYTTILSTRTRYGFDALEIENLSVSVDDWARTVRLSWSVPSFQNQQSVLVLISTSPSSDQVTDGSGYTVGQRLGDAAIVRSTVIVNGYADPGPLALDSTFYYHIYTAGSGVSPYRYSVSVSTRVFLDLPPNSPAGLSSFLSGDRTQMALIWNPVTTNQDGSLFFSTDSPRGVELARYDIYRATSIARAGWVRVSTVALAAPFYTETLPDPNQTFFYRVAAVDSFLKDDRSIVVDTDSNFYIIANDGISRYKFSAALAAELRVGGNKYASDLALHLSTLPANGTDRVFKALELDVMKAADGRRVRDFQFSKADGEMSLHYDVVGGLVVPADLAAQALARPASVAQAEPAGGRIAANEADRQLGMYWDNGQKFVKLYGKVDTAEQMVRVQTSMPGTYQVRGLARTAGFEFDLSDITNKAITPNGDGRNDQVIFKFENPRDSAISGEVFDVTGAKIASLSPGPLPNTLKWDGKAGGRVVPGGVYVYQIRGEGKTFNGTVVVIR